MCEGSLNTNGLVIAEVYNEPGHSVYFTEGGPCQSVLSPQGILICPLFLVIRWKRKRHLTWTASDQYSHGVIDLALIQIVFITHHYILTYNYSFQIFRPSAFNDKDIR